MQPKGLREGPLRACALRDGVLWGGADSGVESAFDEEAGRLVDDVRWEESVMVAEGKPALRRALKERRACLSAETRELVDRRITERLCSLPEYRDANVLFAYLSFGSEVSTRAIIQEAWRAGKKVALPRCVPGTRRMEWYEVQSLDGLLKSPLGVEEPNPDSALRIDASSVGEAAFALIPALAYDLNGYRLGYGGGYYDVFLESFAGMSAGLCREAFLFDDLGDMVESHDRPVDIVVTDERALIAERRGS